MELYELQAHRREILSRVRDFKYERMDNGDIFIPKLGLSIGGAFHVMVNGENPSVEPNLIVDEGLDYILDVGLSGGSAKATWYIAPFNNDVAVAANWQANGGAQFNTTAGETTEYTEADRQTWTDGGVTSQSVDNSGSRAVFTINGTVTVRGAGLISFITKNGAGISTDKLFAASRFSADRNLVNLDELSIQYGITAADVP